MGKGLHLGGVHLTGDVLGLVLFGKNHRTVEKLRRDTGDPNARSLNRQDLVHVAVCKSALKFFADLREEIDVHLVIQKTVHLQHVGALDLPIFANSFLQKLHRPAATLSICKI